ncbi:carboxypeptidase-like regulatory domain-containing protein [Chitinophaga rupis]|nr:carboxypeptidase-like regulatory domain-containing protein [Chitinophaga rupis]
MTPAEGGRFCSHCQKAVIDFSLMTDKEIIAVISNHNKSLCGRFQSAQLNRSLHVPAPPKRSFFPAAVFASLIAALVPESSKAQTLASTTAQSTPIKTEHAKSRAAAAAFKGQIIDSLTGKGLAGVTISLKHKGVEESGAITDGEGKFVLNIPARLRQQALRVNISYIGYASKEVSFDMDQQPLSTTIELKPSNIDLPEIAVVGYGTRTGVVIMGAISIVNTQPVTIKKEEARKRTWWWRITHPFRRR